LYIKHYNENEKGENAKMDLMDKYINDLNKKILGEIDYEKLQQSYQTKEMEYAKTVLKQMHDTFVKVYGTDYLEKYDHEFVAVPAIIKGSNTGEICIGLVELDLQSSGEHWGTIFLTEYGVARQGDEDNPKESSDFISQKYMSYDYWYTVQIEGDIHIDIDEMPEDVAPIYEFCQNGQPNQEQEMGGML